MIMNDNTQFLKDLIPILSGGIVKHYEQILPKNENENQDEQKQIVDQCQLVVSIFTNSGLKHGTRTHKYESNCSFSDIGKMAASVNRTILLNYQW